MGWKKWVRKTIKKVTKPVTKVFKGVAKGIAKVGKSVMRGVAKLNKKLGPLGMIAMSIAMPYALQGLSNIVGTTAGPWGQATGLLGRPEGTFLKAVGKIGNQIRTGYQNIGKFIGTIKNSITDSITKTFTKFSGKSTGKDNIWTRISKGAKRLFSKAKEVTPKFRTGTSGTVDVSGYGNPFGYNQTTQMTAKQAAGLLDAGTITGNQLSNQTLGSAEGWFTKAGSSAADDAIASAINKASESTVKMLDNNSLRYFTDLKGTGHFDNDREILDRMFDNGTSYSGTDWDGQYTTNLKNIGDYKQGTTLPGKPDEYIFTGEKSLNTDVGKKLNLKKYVTKKNVKLLKDSLFKPTDIIEPPQYEFTPTGPAEFGQSTKGSLSSTDVKGSTGSSNYAKVFGTEAWEQLKNYHRNMNYQGDMDYYGGN